MVKKVASNKFLAGLLLVGLSIGIHTNDATIQQDDQIAFKSSSDGNLKGGDLEMLELQRASKWELLQHAAEDRLSQKQDQTIEAAAEIMQDYHVVVPHALVLASQVLQRSINCSNIRVPLHSNTITPAMLLHPPWVQSSERLGNCPTQYKVRHLGQKFNPPALLEAECLCIRSPCSMEGHQCVPVSRQVPVWHRRGSSDARLLTLQEIVVGCACLLRPGLMAGYIVSPWLRN